MDNVPTFSEQPNREVSAPSGVTRLKPPVVAALVLYAPMRRCKVCCREFPKNKSYYSPLGISKKTGERGFRWVCRFCFTLQVKRAYHHDGGHSKRVHRLYYQKHRERYRRYQLEYKRRQRRDTREDPSRLAARRLGGRLKRELHRRATKHVESALLGCSRPQLWDHLMRTMPAGGTVVDFIEGRLHIDHIKPCADFDLWDLAQQKECFHFSNLQLLWAGENFAKGAKDYEDWLALKEK
jgi:hypothetical protein